MYKKILITTTSVLVLASCVPLNHETTEEPVKESVKAPYRSKEIELPNKFPAFETNQEKMEKFYAELERIEKEKAEAEKQRLEELARKKAEAERIKAEEAKRVRQAEAPKQPVQEEKPAPTPSKPTETVKPTEPTAPPTNSNVKTMTVTASAYTYAKYDPYVSEKWGDKTFTGKDVRFGFVAVDPNVIPLGTKMKIEGFGETVFVAEDTGNAIKGNKIDIFLNSYDECIQFGRRNIKIYILG